jgi:hypothetical protein
MLKLVTGNYTITSYSKEINVKIQALYKLLHVLILSLVPAAGLISVSHFSGVHAADAQNVGESAEIKPAQIQENDSLPWSQPIQDPIEGWMVADKDFNPYSILLSTWSPETIRVTFRQRDDIIVNYTRDIDFYDCGDGQVVNYPRVRAQTKDLVVIPVALWFIINNKAYVYRGGKVSPELAQALANAPAGDMFIRAVWPNHKIYDMRVGGGTVAAWKKIYSGVSSQTSITATPEATPVTPAIEPVLLSSRQNISWSNAVPDPIDGMMVADNDRNSNVTQVSTWSANAIRITLVNHDDKISDGSTLTKKYVTCSNGKLHEYRDIEPRWTSAAIVPKELKFLIYDKSYTYRGGPVTTDLAQALGNAPVGDMIVKAIGPDDTVYTMRIGSKTVAAWRTIYKSTQPQLPSNTPAQTSPST